MLMSIGQVSKHANVTNRTLRYYEELGLISPTKRGGNGYRYYDMSHVRRIQTIKLLQESGLELKEIAAAISPQLDPSGKVTYRGQQLAEKVHVALLSQRQAIEDRKLTLDKAIKGLDETLKQLETCFNCERSSCLEECEDCPAHGALEIVNLSQKYIHDKKIAIEGAVHG